MSLMVVLLIILLAALVAGTATSWLVRVAPAQREPSVVPITYRPGSAPPVPRVGGAAIFAAAVATIAAASVAGVPGVGPLVKQLGLYGGIFAGATLLLAVGLADDFLDLSPAVKLLAQLFAAMLAMSGGLSLRQITWAPGHVVVLGWVGVPLALLWVVAVTNAFNFIDGLDGLASTVAAIGFAAAAISAALTARSDVFLLSLVMIGALIGFLRYNAAPARIYLGDGGSLFIGYLLAILTVEGATSSSTGSVLIFVPLFALALPILDATLAVIRRWLRRMPVWKGDHRHVHHRVLALGLSKRASVWVLAAVAAEFATTGLGAAFLGAAGWGPRFLLAAGVLVGSVVLGLRALDYYEFVAVRSALRLRRVDWRRFVREEIRLRDAERELATARDLNELRTGLDRCALAFGLDRIEISRQRPRPRRAWRGEYVDIPTDDTRAASSDGWVLRIWHGEYDSPRPELVRRVGRGLAHACGRWLREYGLVGGAVWPPVAARPKGRRPGRLGGHLARA